jgi:hypothetical protein
MSKSKAKPAKKAAISKAAIKKVAVKKPAPKKAAVKKPIAKKTAKPIARTTLAKPIPIKPADLKSSAKTWRIYIESAAFFPTNSAEGYVDNYQSGRHAATPGAYLLTALPIPVGAKLKSISIHYTNTTSQSHLAFFLRKHADRHSPSGEIEMSFIDLPNTALPPDNYLTVTDTSFPNSGVIQDRFLHYISIPTGDWGGGGRVTVRGLSLVYIF